MSNLNRNMAAIAGFLGLTFRVVLVILGVVNLKDRYSLRFSFACRSVWWPGNSNENFFPDWIQIKKIAP